VAPKKPSAGGGFGRSDVGAKKGAFRKTEYPGPICCDTCGLVGQRGLVDRFVGKTRRKGAASLVVKKPGDVPLGNVSDS